MKNQITITRTGDHYVLSVDGGSIECGTTAEVMSRVGHEMGMPFNKAQRQLFERMETAEKVADETEKRFQECWNLLEEVEKERDMLRAAIVNCFLRAFKEGKA